MKSYTNPSEKDLREQLASEQHQVTQHEAVLGSNIRRPQIGILLFASLSLHWA